MLQRGYVTGSTKFALKDHSSLKVVQVHVTKKLFEAGSDSFWVRNAKPVIPEWSFYRGTVVDIVETHVLP